MARNDMFASEEKARLLRALAFEIRRKMPPDDVLREHIDDQFRLGRRREYRPAADALAADGFAAALQALTQIGDDATVMLAAVVEAKDHRILAGILTALADHLEAH